MQTDKTSESAAEFLSELKNLAGAKPITGAELTSARLTKIRGYAQQFESLNRVAGQVLNLWALGLPMIELQREPESLLGASLAAVNAAAAKYAAPGVRASRATPPQISFFRMVVSVPPQEDGNWGRGRAGGPGEVSASLPTVPVDRPGL